MVIQNFFFFLEKFRVLMRLYCYQIHVIRAIIVIGLFDQKKSFAFLCSTVCCVYLVERHGSVPTVVHPGSGKQLEKQLLRIIVLVLLQLQQLGQIGKRTAACAIKEERSSLC
jgi:hypothetical protein